MSNGMSILRFVMSRVQAFWQDMQIFACFYFTRSTTLLLIDRKKLGDNQRRRCNSSASEKDATAAAYRCKTCSQTLTTHRVLKKHLLHKHLYKEFRKWLYENIQVDAGGKCGVENCKQKEGLQGCRAGAGAKRLRLLDFLRSQSRSRHPGAVSAPRAV